MFSKPQKRRRLLALTIITACLLWAAIYVYEAARDPFGGNETTLFIQPLFFLLLAAGIWAGIEIIFDRRKDVPPPNGAPIPPEDHDTFGATGLADYRRLVLVTSFPLMLVLISMFGFVVSAALYVSVMAFGLGERRSPTLALMSLLAIAVVWLFFRALLGVPLALWPPVFG